MNIYINIALFLMFFVFIPNWAIMEICRSKKIPFSLRTSYAVATTVVIANTILFYLSYITTGMAIFFIGAAGFAVLCPIYLYLLMSPRKQ